MLHAAGFPYLLLQNDILEIKKTDKVTKLTDQKSAVYSHTGLCEDNQFVDSTFL